MSINFKVEINKKSLMILESELLSAFDLRLFVVMESQAIECYYSTLLLH